MVLPQVYVLDGGFSTQIAKHVGTSADGDPLWSAKFLQTHPDEVLKTHLDFLRAGSDIIMTNTYQASIPGFVKFLRVTPEEGNALIIKAVTLAKRAREIYLQENPNTSRKPLIAGSVGPYGAYLHDGSEYRGTYADATSVDTMREWHTPRIRALVDAGVDLLAFETLPCEKEAVMLLELLKQFPNMKAWLSLSCKDEFSLAHGENFQNTALNCYNTNPEQLIAIGTNCCSPSIVANLFKNLNNDRVDPIPLITYPNSGEKYDVSVGWFGKEQCMSLNIFVEDWLNMGVRYVGGCCRTTSEDISKIRAQVDKWIENKSKTNY